MVLTDEETSDRSALPAAFSLFDCTSIIVGIIIGSAIYEITPLVAASASVWVNDTATRLAPLVGRPQPDAEALQSLSTAAVILLWLVGGLIALVGAMCYAELATAYPHAGGTYVFLSEGLGRSAGFAFAWFEFWIVRPGNIGAIAFVMAKYALQLIPAGVRPLPQLEMWIAAGAILLLTIINLLGLQAGKWTQNALTVAKLAGLAVIVAVGMTLAPGAAANQALPHSAAPLSVALVLIMFAYGGWTDMSFIAAEVRDGRRNIFRALVSGTVVVAAIYVAVNLAFIHAEGIAAVANSEAVAARVLARRWGTLGSAGISLLVVVSCLGAINGMVFTGARVYYALGMRHPMFRWLGTWNETTGVPWRSLLLQAVITLALVIGFGRHGKGFERLVVFTGPFYWGFIGLAALSLIALRERRQTVSATYRVPLFPLTPAAFLLSCAAMTFAALDYAFQNLSWAVLWALAVIAGGGLLAWLDFRSRQAERPLLPREPEPEAR